MSATAYEERARTVKVSRIAHYIWSHLTPDQRCDPATVERVRDATTSGRREVAEQAGCKYPSDATWALVVERVGEFCEIARDVARQAGLR